MAIEDDEGVTGEDPVLDDLDLDPDDVGFDDLDDEDDDIPADEQPGSTGPTTWRWAFAGACVVGLALGWTVFAWMLTHGGHEILPEKNFAGSFFDIQGRAILDGRLDVPTDSLGIEGFVVNGRTYAYFGPVPAMLRLPVLALTDQFDGRMSVVSMALAWVVGGVFAALLLWRVRRFVRGDLPFTNTEFIATALALAAYGGGSSLVILAARPVVYQEADVWGSALTLASLWAVVGVLERLTYRRILVASAFATLAFLTRATLGLVATVTLAAVTVAVAGEWWGRRRHPGHDAQRLFGRTHLGWGLLGILCLATICPVVAYASVNRAKFDTPFRLPMETQVMSGLDPHRKEMLRANDNAFFRPGFVPTTALTYFRPDGIRVSRDFPFVFLPERAQDPIGDYVFDRIDPTPGLLPTMPFWAGLAGWGLFCAFRPRPRCRPSVKRLRTPLIGAAMGTLGVLSIAFIAPRYLGDFLPFVVLAGAVGLYDVIDRTDGSRRPVRVALLAVLAVTAALSFIVNAAIGYTIRSVEGSPPDFLSYLQTRLDVGRHLGDPLANQVERGQTLSRQGGPDRLFIMGDCDGLYWSDGQPPGGLAITNWRPVERGPRAGEQHVGIRFGVPPAGSPSRQPLLGVDDKLGPTTLYVEHLGDGRVRFNAVTGDTEFGRPSDPVSIDPNREYDARIVADKQTGELSLTLDGMRVLDSFAASQGDTHLGQPGVLLIDPALLPPTTNPTTTKPSSTPSTSRGPRSSTSTTSRPTSTTTSSTTTKPSGPPPVAGVDNRRINPTFTGSITPRSTETPLCHALLDELSGRS